MNAKTGDIVFVRGKSWISRTIKFFDRGEFSHVAVFISPEEIIEAEYSTTARIVPFEYPDYEIIKVNITFGQQERVKNIAKDLEGTRYDMFQIIRLFLKIVFGIKEVGKFNNLKQLACSELAGVLSMEMGYGGEELINMTPNELYRYLKEEVKQG
jgi:hypothetical protein